MQRQRRGGHLAALEEGARPAKPIERQRAGPDEQEERRDAQHVDLLEDALERERDHREDAEQNQKRGGDTREQPHPDEDAGERLDPEDRVAEPVLRDLERGNEEKAGERRPDEGDADVEPQRERRGFGESLERAERPRLRHVALDPGGRGGGGEGDGERGQDRA